MRAAMGNRTRPNFGVRARHLPPAEELAPWSARRGATDLQGVAHARIQAQVNDCVERTAIYGCGVGESHACDLGREILPLAAGWETRPLASRAWDHRPALRASGKNTSTRKRMRKAYSPPSLGRASSPLAAGWGTRPLVARAWCGRRASRGSGKNTGTRKQLRKAYSVICARR